MSHDVNVNKIDDKHKKEAEKLADKYQKQGMGHDQAKNQALEDVAPEKASHKSDQSDHQPSYDNEQKGNHVGPTKSGK